MALFSHRVVLKNLHFNMYMYPLQRVFGLKYLTPHWLAWFYNGHFLYITGYYSNHITCLSKTMSSSALWTYNFNEFGNPQFLIFPKMKSMMECTFWQVKDLAQSHLNVSNSVNVAPYPLLKFILNFTKMLESASSQFNLRDVLRGTSTFN